jgi:type I restriction enzyme, R subunit
VIDKKTLSERDICTKFITPALRRAGWDEITQIREEVTAREAWCKRSFQKAGV